jgi:release factor glutamine methyltransferase
MNSSIHDLLAEGTRALTAAGISEPRVDGALLLAHVIERDRTFIIAHPEHPIAADQLEEFREFIARRAAGEPLQYITGHQEFFGLDFQVTPDVLIPRPETEIIVEAALEFGKADPRLLIADIGTGSGCLIVSLLHKLPHARGIGTDISFGALRVARENARNHRVLDRLELIQADSFSALASQSGFSLIVSNPPYVRMTELDNLPREVRDHEPLNALVSGSDGLSQIRVYLREAAGVLRPCGHFVFEIGFGQREAVEELIDAAVWDLLEIRNDLQNIPRTFVLQKR